MLSAHGVRRGDVVSVYLPMVPQLMWTLLACARMGAVHSAIFAGFSRRASAEAHRERGLDGRRHGGRGRARREDRSPEGRRGRRGHARRCSERGARRLRPGQHRAGAGGARPGVPGWVDGRDASLDDATAAVFAATKGCGLPLEFAPAIMGSGGSALPALHERDDWQAEGRRAHDGGLHGVGRDDVQVCVLEGRGVGQLRVVEGTCPGCRARISVSAPLAPTALERESCTIHAVPRPPPPPHTHTHTHTHSPRRHL